MKIAFCPVPWEQSCLHLLSPSSGVDKIPPGAFLSQDWTISALLASLHMINALNPLCSLLLDSLHYAHVSTKQLSSHSFPGLYCCLGLFLLRYRELCWTLQCSCWPISPSCQDPCEWQHNHLVHQLFVPVLRHLQACWEWFLLCYPGH